MQKKIHNHIPRPPVIAVMGHVDHGKSTLLDYIRKTNIVESEAGGITQKISAYEVTHTTSEGKVQHITFLDTPGHAAFQAIRARGAQVADIAILVVSAEDGVRPQTLEALQTITSAKIPFVVAINKIDKEGANIENTKAGLAEHGVYVEGFGGDIPFVLISAKNGTGIPELLDMLALVAELENLKGTPSEPASGIIIEANVDRKRGISATLIIKNGSLKTGMYVVADTALTPVRILENFLGKAVKEATFSSPIRLTGWNELPAVGTPFITLATKNEAEAYIESKKKEPIRAGLNQGTEEEIASLPIVIKASDMGGLEGLMHELKKIKNEKIKIKIIQSGVGDISEGDVKLAGASAGSLVVGFNAKLDTQAKAVAEKLNVEVKTFDIIYKISEWLEQIIVERTPKTRTEEATGTAKVIRIFSKVKDRQVLGGRVEKGQILMSDEVKIMRRDFEVGRGKIKELQRLKNRVSEVPEGQEFGALVESKIEIAPGDRLESFRTVEK